MDGLHDAHKRAEGQLGDAGKGGFQNHGESAQLQGDDTAQDGSQGDLDPARGFCSQLGKQLASHDGAP